MVGTLQRPEVWRVGTASGLGAAAGIAIYAAFAQLDAGEPVAGTYAFFARVLAGPAATGASWAVPVGILALVLGSIAWGVAYVYAGQGQPQLFTRPILSGLIFGFCIWLFAEMLLIPFGMFHPTGVYAMDRDIIGCSVFFGLPLSLVAARLSRKR